MKTNNFLLLKMLMFYLSKWHIKFKDFLIRVKNQLQGNKSCFKLSICRRKKLFAFDKLNDKDRNSIYSIYCIGKFFFLLLMSVLVGL